MRMFILIVFVALCTAAATPPTYGAPSFVSATGGNIDVGYYGAPCMADWNGDGVYDLLLGQFDLGKIRLYINSGTNSAPVFTTFSYIQSSGADITLPYG